MTKYVIGLTNENTPSHEFGIVGDQVEFDDVTGYLDINMFDGVCYLDRDAAINLAKALISFLQRKDKP